MSCTTASMLVFVYKSHHVYLFFNHALRLRLSRKKKEKKNKVIKPKSRASALSKKSVRQTDEQTKTFKKAFELATKSLKNNFVTNQWTEQQMDG